MNIVQKEKLIKCFSFFLLFFFFFDMQVSINKQLISIPIVGRVWKQLDLLHDFSYRPSQQRYQELDMRKESIIKPDRSGSRGPASGYIVIVI